MNLITNQGVLKARMNTLHETGMLYVTYKTDPQKNSIGYKLIAELSVSFKKPNF